MTARIHERTALVIVLGELGALDGVFKKLENGKVWRFIATPSHQQGDVVLLGASGAKVLGNLYCFVGMLTGCRHEGVKLAYEDAARFACPVTATYGNHLHRDDLLGDREGWGPHVFNYVLPVALKKVPMEAEELLRHDPRRD